MSLFHQKAETLIKECFNFDVCRRRIFYDRLSMKRNAPHFRTFDLTIRI